MKSCETCNYCGFRQKYNSNGGYNFCCHMAGWHMDSDGLIPFDSPVWENIPSTKEDGLKGTLSVSFNASRSGEDLVVDDHVGDGTHQPV